MAPVQDRLPSAAMALLSRKSGLAAPMMAALLPMLAAALVGCGGVQAKSTLPPRAPPRAVHQAKACDAGDADACYWIGTWLLVGGGVPESRVHARVFIDRACKAGQLAACGLQRKLGAAASRPAVKPRRATRPARDRRTNDRDFLMKGRGR